MPTRELTAYVEALPAVMASRSLEAVAELAVGTGSMKKAARDEILAAWRRDIRLRQRVARPSPGELRGMAAAAGIGVRPLKRKEPSAGA